MRCLFIPTYPLTPHRGGGGAIGYEQLCSIHELGHEIHLWHFSDPTSRMGFDKYMTEDARVWSEVQAMCQSVTFTTFPEMLSLVPRLRRRILLKIVHRWLNDEIVLNPMLINHPSLKAVAFPMMQQLITEVKPDFIWAEHLLPAQVAVLQTEVPVVFSHSDWLYHITALRSARPENIALRAAEENVARKATRIVSGSMVESEELRAIGCKFVDYIPLSYEPATFNPDAEPSQDVRLVHFGNLWATSNLVGLQRFFEQVWPVLLHEAPNLWVVGDISSAPPELAEFLAGVTCTGHVKEWETVLRPYDLHIIPWEHSTGQRTRVPAAFNCGQVIVAVRAGIAGFPEAIDSENCRLVDSINQMGPVIKELLHDRAQRERLGKAARRTFERCFTRHTLLPRYEVVIAGVSQHDEILSR